jgi:uncharacterized protein
VQARLDPRAPFVLDVRELGRRPGAMQRLEQTVPAPAGLGIDVIGVPEGTEVDLSARLESVSDGVLVTAEVTTTVVGECSRCLDPITRDLTVDVQELYVYDLQEAQDEGDEDAVGLEGDLLDLEPAVRDALVLALPVAPLCQESCLGLCPECGTRLDDEPGHTHDATDPRWSALQTLVGETPPASNAPDTSSEVVEPDQEES